MTMIRRRTYWDLGTKCVSRSWTGHRYYGFRTINNYKHTRLMLQFPTVTTFTAPSPRSYRRIQTWKKSFKNMATGNCLFLPPGLSTYLIHGTESFLNSWPFISWSRNSPHFMEPEGSLPHSQEPATCPYPKPDQSSPCPHISLPEDPS